jgi:hypothetical protein
MLQKLHKSLTTSTELTPDQKYNLYTEVVSDVLQAYYAHSLRTPPDNFGAIVAHWTNLFIKVGIPASQLMDVYLESHSTMNKGDYFNIDTVIATWNSRHEKRVRESLLREPCSVCKGTTKTMQLDFKTRKDIQIDCPKCI